MRVLGSIFFTSSPRMLPPPPDTRRRGAGTARPWRPGGGPTEAMRHRRGMDSSLQRDSWLCSLVQFRARASVGPSNGARGRKGSRKSGHNGKHGRKSMLRVGWGANASLTPRGIPEGGFHATVRFRRQQQMNLLPWWVPSGTSTKNDSAHDTIREICGSYWQQLRGGSTQK